ncbi:MAG: AAA family ATPase [Clostridiales bacterium]|nr:AAA family ATPase [Clostridiales bacterium]
MRLISCHIENFGKLRDLTMEFQHDCHILCEANGWGKSTLTVFLRVMFFGFEGETKRKGIENERRRYLPWQGGAYGGTVTFETGGRTYTVTRSFSDKKINDSFELRDARTNLPSADFSENLGEEIFHINRESFLRTVFIGQNDCVTHATDSINAKIGNFTDNMNDLDSYEKAAGAMQDVLNKLNPRRKTGTIHQMNDQITRLQTEISQNRPLRSSIRRYEAMEAEEKEKLREKRREQEEVLSLQKRVSRMQDKRVRRAAYLQLCAACEEAVTACRTAEAWFPGEVPAEEKLRECQKACDEMERAAQGAQICRLTSEEREQLENLEAQRAEAQRMRNHSERYDDGGLWESPEEPVQGTLEQNGFRERRAPRTEKDAGQVGDRKRLRMPAGVIIAVVGAVCCLCSLLSKIFPSDGLFPNTSRSLILFPGMLIPGVLLLSAGVIFFVMGAMLRVRDQERDTLKRDREEKAQLQEEEIQKQAENERNLERLYVALAKKQRDYQMYREQYEQKRKYVSDAFAEMGMRSDWHTEPDRSAREQLQEIRQRRTEWQRAKTAAEAAKLKKQEFESQNETDVLLPDETEQDMPDLESLNQRQRQLESDGQQIQSRLNLYKNQLASLREQYDEWTQAKEMLQSEQEQLADLKKKFGYVKKAQEYLSAAKETLTARYMEPLMHSFSRYYEILAGTSGTPAEKYRMDANTNLTVEEAGMQRETQYLSRGYQDLIGLCLRFSLVDAMYPDEKPFLILDDPFVNLDAEKTAGGMRLLREVSESCQIIYVTGRTISE